MIELVDVSKRYDRAGAAWAVQHVDATIGDGELVALVGESGSGKTTLLKMVNRLIDADRGEIRVAGRNVRDQDPVALRRTIGYVIQQAGLLPHLSVADNVAMVPKLLGWSGRDIAARVDELLAMVGLPAETFRARFPDQLSGGQRQRVNIARALMNEPSALVVDEPTSALDQERGSSILALILRLTAEFDTATILVTHDQRLLPLMSSVHSMVDGGLTTR